MNDKDPQNWIRKPGKWTVMIYLAGDNNLSEECVFSLTEIKEAISVNSDKLTVVAQFDPAGVRAETKRYLLQSKKTSLEEDARATGWKAQETDTGEPHNLLEFLRWGISTYPADHYMVVLVGHGSGTDDDFLLHDDNPPDALSILELRYVFDRLTDDGHTIDILGMDTCLMNMAEVCFELLRTNVTYLVGSEGFSPNTGWPYREIIRQLSAAVNGDGKQADVDSKVVEPQKLARTIVDEYKNFYEPYINGGISVDQSVLQVKKIDEVKKRMFSLMGALLDEFKAGELEYRKPKQNALLLAHWETQSYNGEVFVDLYDFCTRLALRYNDLISNSKEKIESKVPELCEDVKTAINDLVIRSCVAGAAFQFSFGVSIYFPWANLSPNYGNLAFPKDSMWLDFLKLYHLKTRRLGRNLTEGKDTQLPGRASVPTNKGRDGHVESMRNPPNEDVKMCSEVDVSKSKPPVDTATATQTTTPSAAQTTARTKKPAKAETTAG